MKDNFDYALKLVLSVEGNQFTNRLNDMGGPTRLGITLNTLKDARRDFDYGDFDHDGDVDIDDVRLLDTPEEAALVYRKLFWEKIYGDELPAGLDYLMFDSAVNHGPRNAGIFLQRAINRLKRPEVAVDGFIGPKTVAAALSMSAPGLARDVIRERDIFYHKIVSRHPEQQENFRGWMNRLAKVAENINSIA
jgi:lysozyme family protein